MIHGGYRLLILVYYPFIGHNFGMSSKGEWGIHILCCKENWDRMSERVLLNEILNSLYIGIDGDQAAELVIFVSPPRSKEIRRTLLFVLVGGIRDLT
jgi:hypothetical protein